MGDFRLRIACADSARSGRLLSGFSFSAVVGLAQSTHDQSDFPLAAFYDQQILKASVIGSYGEGELFRRGAWVSLSRVKFALVIMQL